MAEFKVEVIQIDDVVKHPNADSLDLLKIRGWVSVAKLGQFKKGDMVAYIPESSIIPDFILSELGLVGKLSGPEKNKVTAIRLRGVVSQGICIPCKEGWKIGDDVSGELGIIKYIPEIPKELLGTVMVPKSGQQLIKYDIENYQKYPSVLREGEPVVFSEKIHGINFQCALLQDDDGYEFIVTSKGLGEQGLAFQLIEENSKNIYVRSAIAFDLENKMRKFHSENGFGDNLYIIGEIFGEGIQDLAYGASTDDDAKIGLRIFDVFIGKPNAGRWANDSELDQILFKMGLERPPVLYRGPYNEEVRLAYTNGKESVSGLCLNVREGIVMKPTIERASIELSRVQLKSISNDYLFRKGTNGQEPTEFS